MNKTLMYSYIRRIVQTIMRVDCVSKPVFECNICKELVRHPFHSPRYNSAALRTGTVIGGGFRPKSRCSFCLACDRLRFSVEVLRHYTDILVRPCDVLEFAPDAATRHFLRQNDNCRYSTGDIVPGRGDMVLDITNIDLPDQSYDYVICHHVLEHIADETAAVNELRRILKPDGLLLLSMPIDISRATTFEDPAVDTPKKRLEFYGQDDHVRLYGLDAKSRLEAYGLKVREIVAKDAFPELVSRYGLIPDDRNYLCSLA